MTTTLVPIYSDTPHEIVAAHNDLEITNPRDFDLTSTVQFVSGDHAVQFDFSTYALVSEDLKNIESERARLTDELRAFNTLLDTITEAHDAFTVNASRALDLLASLQQS